jgi:hypothetical protein
VAYLKNLSRYSLGGTEEDKEKHWNSHPGSEPNAFLMRRVVAVLTGLASS